MMVEVKTATACQNARWYGIEDGLADCVSRHHDYENPRERWSYMQGFREGLRQREELLSQGITDF
jgi:hypothetical protein